MAYPPSSDDFRAYFRREFIYGDGFDKIQDADITRALAEVTSLFNPALFSTVVQQTTGYLYAAAHFLVMNIQGAGGLSALPRGRGVRNSAESVFITKSAGQMSVQMQVPPQWIQNSAVLLYFFRTDFGQRYIQMVAPRLVGHAAVVCGPTPNQFNQE